MKLLWIALGIGVAFAAGWWARGTRDDIRETAPDVLPSMADAPAPGPRLTTTMPPREASRDDVPPPSRPAFAAGDAAPEQAESATPRIADPHVEDAHALIAQIGPLLRKGRAAHIDLWRLLQELTGTDAHDWIWGDGEAEAPAQHVWRRFLIAHEAHLAVFWEEAYRVLLEERPDEDDRSIGALELLDPNLGAWLVAALPPDRFARLRETVRALVRSSDERWARRSLAAVLGAWARAVPPEQATAMLRSDDVTGIEVNALLDRVEPEALEASALTDVLVRMLDEGATWSDLTRTLSKLSERGTPLDAAGRDRLDERVREMSATKNHANHAKRLLDYASSTGRGRWPDIEGFIDAGLKGQGKAPGHFALVLTLLRSPAPDWYVKRVAGRDGLPAHVKRALHAHLEQRK